MKPVIKNIIKIIAFSAIGILLFHCFTQAFHFKYGKSIECSYDLPADSVDVLIVGSSHAYRNINPAVLYENSGITGYVAGSASQYVWISYYYIKELLKTQKPEVIILECYKIYSQVDSTEDSLTIRAASGMKMSKNFIDMINTSVGDADNKFDYYLMFPWYHSRYREINESDFKPYFGKELYKNYLGYLPIRKSLEMEIPDGIEKIEKKKDLTDRAIEYLDKIRELAQEKDIELLFVLSPFCEKAAERQPYYNSLAEYADHYQIPLIQGNYLYEELGLDGNTDFGRGNHLSKTGADKFTLYLNNYLNEHYSLDDHRGDPYYQRWEENMKYMQNSGNDEPDAEDVEDDD